MTINNSPVTMGTLMQFTEEVLLPAMKELIRDEFKNELPKELAPIKQDIAYIKRDIEDIKADISFIKKENYNFEKSLESKISIYRFERFKKFNGLKEELEK